MKHLAKWEKLIDDLQLSQIGAKKRKPVPPVPEFTTPKHSSKISPTDLFGPSDSESVSEADWAALNAHSSESEVAAVEENYSEKSSGSEVSSSSAEESGSDYESGSSFEEAKRRKSKRSTRGSAT